MVQKSQDREPVVELTARLAQKHDIPFEDAAEMALRKFYCLGPHDGIWGGSDAAVGMGYENRHDEDNLLGEIAADVAHEAAVPVAPAPGMGR